MVRTPLWRALLLEHRLPYRYKQALAKLNYRLRYFFFFILNEFKPKCILFYPDVPEISFFYEHGYVIPKICHLYGYKITNNINKNFDLFIRWQDNTFQKDDRVLSNLAKKYEIINYKCTDISKQKISCIFSKVFEYNIDVNPLKYKGLCVKKSNLNAKHDGKIIKCPIKKIEKGFVYQKLINNQIDKYFIKDIRVPIFKDKIPFVYLKYKKKDK